MDSFNYVNVKVEKANAILRYRRRQRITTLFRVIELCFFLVVISRFSVQLPFNIKISGNYLRGLTVSLLSPRFVFLIGNLIVIVLVLKSGWLSAENRTGYGASTGFTEEIVENIVKSPIVHRIETENRNQNQKRTIRNPVIVIETENRNQNQKRTIRNPITVETKMSRSKSASSIKEGVEKPRRQLRRVATESSREGAPAANLGREEELNGEEFRQKVEAFIARQQRNLREEEFSAIVSY